MSRVTSSQKTLKVTCNVSSSIHKSPAKENRKTPKPLIERKRRARINKSLLELEKLLSNLIVEEAKTRKNGKVEKADILEIAVRKMKELLTVNANRHFIPIREDVPEFRSTPSSSSSFIQGFEAAFREVELFLENNIPEFNSFPPTMENHNWAFKSELVSQLRERKRGLLTSLGFCSVIRHTKEISESEVSSTVSGLFSPSSSVTSIDSGFGSSMSSSSSPITVETSSFEEGGRCSTPWRPWWNGM